jgi:methyl coenzyme M reductase alpha subunit
MKNILNNKFHFRNLEVYIIRRGVNDMYDFFVEEAIRVNNDNSGLKSITKKIVSEINKKFKERKLQYIKATIGDDNTFSVENLAKLAEKSNSGNYNKAIENVEKSIISIVKSVAKEIARPAGYTVDVFNSDIGGKDAYITFGVYKKKL